MAEDGSDFLASSDDDDPKPKPKSKRANAPKRKAEAPVADAREGARTFVRGTIGRVTDGKCALRYPSEANQDELQEKGISLYSIYVSVAHDPVSPSIFAGVMRELKGHPGACKAGCGCLLDGVNHLKKIAVERDGRKLANMLQSMKDGNQLDAAWYSDLDGGARLLQSRLVELGKKTLRGKHGSKRPDKVAVRYRKRSAPGDDTATAPAPGSPIPTLESAPLRASLSSANRVSELLADAVDLLNDSPDSKAKLKDGLARAQRIVRRSLTLPEGTGPMDVNTFRFLDLAMRHPKALKRIKEDALIRAHNALATATTNTEPEAPAEANE